MNHVRTELIKTMNQRVGLPHRMKAYLTVKESKTNVKYKLVGDPKQYSLTLFAGLLLPQQASDSCP